MGDWEDIFGEGVSGESVADTINHYWFAEIAEGEREARRTRAAKRLSFFSDDEVRAEFDSLLTRHLTAVLAEYSSKRLWDANQLWPIDVHDVQRLYGIPVLTMSIISEVAAFLLEKNTLLAINWLRKIVASLPHGHDLEIASTKFIADCVRALERDDDFEADRHAKAASIVYLRARGVRSSKVMCKDAQTLAWGGPVEPEIDECEPYADYILCHRVFAAAAAADPKEVALSLRYCVLRACQCRRFGDMRRDEVAVQFGKNFEEHIANAPKLLLRPIELESLHCKSAEADDVY